MKLLFSNGDSHTAGNEMEHVDQVVCYEKAWPKQLSDKLDLENINIAKPGAGNYRIFRTTQDWVINNVILNKIYDPKDLIVVVMWSGFDREEIYFPDTNTIDDLGFSSPMTSFNTQYKRELKMLKDSLVLFHDDLVSNFKSLSLVYNLSTFLESLDIKYYFLNGIYNFMKVDNLNEKHRLYFPYRNLILAYGNRIDDFLGFYKKEDMYFYYMRNFSGVKPPEHSKFSHYGEDGHKIWADVVYNKYFKLI